MGNELIKQDLNVENNLEVDNNLSLEVKQNSFLETTLGKVVNTGIDIGLRAVLPDLIENQVIDVKNVLLRNGLKEGINQMIKSAIDLGKSAVGIFTGKFENISQVENAVKKGGIIDSTSGIIDNALKLAQKNNMINNNTASLIKQGKNVILDNVEKNIENVMTKQVKSLENINKYSENWKNFYEQKDFSNMEKEYKKLEKELKNVIPLENTIKQARMIENLQNLIKNKGEDFNLTDNEIELANKLA